MKHLALFLTLLFLVTHVSANDAVSFESFGNSGVAGVICEHQFNAFEQSLTPIIQAGVGLGAFAYDYRGTYLNISIPVAGGFFTGRNNSHFELTAGSTFMLNVNGYNNYFTFPIQCGYRHQSPNAGFLFRVYSGVALYVASSYFAFGPKFGISFGGVIKHKNP